MNSAFKIVNDMYSETEELRSKLFDLRKKLCKHPEKALTITLPNTWACWPDSGTDPGKVRCENCNTLIKKNWGRYAPRKGRKTFEEE